MHYNNYASAFLRNRKENRYVKYFIYVHYDWLLKKIKPLLQIQQKLHFEEMIDHSHHHQPITKLLIKGDSTLPSQGRAAGVTLTFKF